MRIPMLAMFPLSGCYLLADGTISVTCEDDPSCAGQKDTETDSDNTGTDDSGGWGGEGLSIERGVAFSATDGQSWTLSAFAPPDLSEQIFQRGGQGDFAGPLLFDAVNSRAVLAAGGRLYTFGDTVDQVSSLEIPSDLGVVALTWIPEGLCLITTKEIFWQGAGASALVQLDTHGSPEGERLDVFPDEDGTGMYLLTRSSADEANLYHFDQNSGGTLIAERVVANPGLWLGGGGFIGPDRVVSFCSTDGAVYTLPDLVAGETTAVVHAQTSAPVLRCAWDDGAKRYLVVTSRGEVVALSPDGQADIVSADPLDAALTAVGVSIY